MKIMTRYAAISTLAVLLAGCSDDAGSLTQDQADLAVAAVTEVMESAVDAALSQAAAPELRLGGDPISVTVPCPDGGEAGAQGELIDATELAIAVAFTDCAVGELAIDGEVDSAVEVGVGVITQTAAGELSFAGAFEASCALELEIERGLASVSVSATICGVSVP